MKRLIAGALIAAAAMFSLHAQDAEAIRDWEETTWRLNIVLEFRELDQQAVQFAVFRNDPVPEFTRTYREFSSRMKDEGRDRYTDEASMMSVTWDIMFRRVTGDELYLLVAGDPNTLSSNDKPGRIWLVTKSSGSNGEPLAWVLACDVETGKGIDGKLTGKNCIYLKDGR